MCRSIVIAIIVTLSTIAVCSFIQLRQTEHFAIVESPLENIILPNRICQTAQCVIASSSILRQMNLQANTCEDFGKFSCGGQLFNELQNANSYLWKIRKLLENGSPSDHSRISYIVCRDFYRSCTDLRALRQKGLLHLKEAIELMGGWPLLMDDNWNMDGMWNWQVAVRNVVITDMEEAFVKIEKSDINGKLMVI